MDSNPEETIIYTRKGASKVDMKEPESFNPTDKDNDTSEESSLFLGANIHEWEPLNHIEVLSIFCFLFLKFRTSEPINYAFIRSMQLGLQKEFENINESADDRSLMLAGSMADEIFIPGKSDIDCLVVDKTKLCVKNEECIMNIKDVFGVNIYLDDCLNASPGYTRVHKTIIKPVLKNQVTFLRSGELLHELSEVNIEKHDDVPIKGPALQTNFSHMFQSCGFNVFVNFENWSNDIVAAIPYRNESIIDKWKKRKRLQAWPLKEIQQEISEMPGYIVKIGKKGSMNERYEWRICYTSAEIKLVKSLNKVQKMLYYKLKEFTNTVLKPKSPDVTSYILRNIVFWIAESVPGDYFTSRNFIPLFRSTLFVLKRCVEKQELPNYMIPERNLFDGKFTDGNTELIEVLSHWIKNCPIIEGENQKALEQCYNQIKCSPHKFIQDFEQTPRFCETNLIPRISPFVKTFLKESTSTDYENRCVDRRSSVCVNALCMLLSREPSNWMNVVIRLVQNYCTTLAKNK